MSRADAARLVDYFCRDPQTAAYGPYRLAQDTPVTAEDAQEALPGHLYRFRMVDSEGRSVQVQVFLGLGELGGLLWEQDVRALLRASAVGHPALPEVLAGGHQIEGATLAAGVAGGAGFTATRSGTEVAGARTAAYFASRPKLALRWFKLLLDALATLHDLGITHRNLFPGAIDVRQSEQSGELELRLARFEMSMLISDLFHTTVSSAEDGGALHHLLQELPAEALFYLPPERAHRVLAGSDPTDTAEDSRSDVFALGTIVAEWFLGPFDVLEDLDAARVTGAPQGRLLAELDGFHSRLRGLLNSSEAVPADLAAILLRMLAADPQDRPEPQSVLLDLEIAYERIVAAWDPLPSGKPHALLFMPNESAATIERWGWLTYSLKTPDGRHELAALIQEDVRGAQMFWASSGADGIVQGGDNAAKQLAQYVIIGARAAWFCVKYVQHDAYEMQTTARDDALLVKYVARRDDYWVDKRLRDLLRTAEGRSMPEVEMIPSDISKDLMNARLAERPSWEPRLPSVSFAHEGDPWLESYKRAIDWLLDYRSTEIDARLYPYVAEGAQNGGEITAVWSRGKDDIRIARSPLFVKYASSRRRRPDFGDFFGDLENEDGSSDVEIVTMSAERSQAPKHVTEARIVRRAGQDRVVLRAKRGSPPVPDEGWLRPLDDRYIHISLLREREARWELLRHRTLLAQLRAPSTIRGLARRWKGAGDELLGDGAAAVLEFLVCQPFSALQGPPGTGKTTVAAKAVAAYLTEHPEARVLVSAQSNFALDNLAARILGEFGLLDEHGRMADRVDGPVAVRVTSKLARMDDRLRPWLSGNLAARRLSQLTARAQERISAGTAVPDELALLHEWRAVLGSAESIGPELADRLRRAANLVFATCATSTAQQVCVTPAPSNAFDWVIVEEAAKAWPTELAIPLVRGFRWTLIGDHFQLPAHRRDEVDRFLADCAADPHAQSAGLSVEHGRFMETFDLFKTLFKPRERPKAGERAPLTQLTTQFRMRRPIGEVVSRIFYPSGQERLADGLWPGSLTTMARHPAMALKSPAGLDGLDLVWLDTSDLAWCAEEPRWCNPGEAEVVAALVEALDPAPKRGAAGYGENPLAVLTPYRDQVDLLRRNGTVNRFVNTVHEFQGKEADVVIVSLVRGLGPGRTAPDGPAARAFGHLSQPNLANVLISRARRLLILVGDLRLYEQAHGEAGFWRDVCLAVRLGGEVLPAGRVLELSRRRTRLSEGAA